MGAPAALTERPPLPPAAGPRAGAGREAGREGWTKGLLQFAPTALASLSWVLMRRASDWREQRNSHFLPRWGPSSCGRQPAGRCEATEAAAAGWPPAPAPAPGPWCVPGPVLPQLSGVLGPHPACLPVQRHSRLQRFLRSPSFGWGALSVSFQPNWRGQVGTLVLLESSVLTLLAPGLLCPSPRLAPVDQAATSLVSRPDVCTLPIPISLAPPPSPAGDNWLLPSPGLRSESHKNCCQPQSRHQQSASNRKYDEVCHQFPQHHPRPRQPPSPSTATPDQLRWRQQPRQHQRGPRDCPRQPTMDEQRPKNATITTQL